MGGICDGNWLIMRAKSPSKHHHFPYFLLKPNNQAHPKSKERAVQWGPRPDGRTWVAGSGRRESSEWEWGRPSCPGEREASTRSNQPITHKERRREWLWDPQPGGTAGLPASLWPEGRGGQRRGGSRSGYDRLSQGRATFLPSFFLSFISLFPFSLFLSYFNLLQMGK